MFVSDKAEKKKQENDIFCQISRKIRKWEIQEQITLEVERCGMYSTGEQMQHTLLTLPQIIV